MKKSKLINKVIFLASALLIATQFTACGSQSSLSGLGASNQQALTRLTDAIESEGDFSLLAAAKPAPKKPAAKPVPKKLPPPKPLPKAFMDALKKYPELLPGFAALKGLPPHEHFPKLQTLVKDYPDLVKLLPKPPAGAPPAPPSGTPPASPTDGMQPPPPGDGGMMPPPPEGTPPVDAPPAPVVIPEASPEATPTPAVNDVPAEGGY